MAMTFSQSLVSTGLTTVSFGVPQPGTFQLTGKISLPTLANGGGVSAVVTTITQNSSTIYTGPAGGEGFGLTVVTAAGDTIGIAFTSANAVDQGLNAIKATIAFG